MNDSNNTCKQNSPNHLSTSASSNTSVKKTGKSWVQLKSVVEFSRKLMSNLNVDVPSNIYFRNYFNKQTGRDENRIYFLAGTQKRDITIKYIHLNSNTQFEKITGYPIFNSNINFSNEKTQLTKEEQLLRERKRCPFNGISSFYMESCRLVFSERSEIYYFDDNITTINENLPRQIVTSSKGAIDVKICPANPNLVSYILHDNLWIHELEKEIEIQLTFSKDPIKSGVPSYAVQEEFNRYTGYWWQPVSEIDKDENTTYRIVYEEINDDFVDLTFITPSCENEFGYDTYRYPKAGTPNSKIYLKMIEIIFNKNSVHPTIKTKKMQKSFYEIFDWYEYLVKADWVNNGKYFWTHIYDRLQMHMAMVLVPLEYFVDENCENIKTELINDEDCSLSKNVILVSEQKSITWINYHNILYFLDEKTDENCLSFITGSDESGFLHLYYYKLSIDSKDLYKYSNQILKTKSLISKRLTDGDWCVEYDDNVSVDVLNHLVYFTGYKNPLESHLFVVDLNNPLSIKQLTQDGFSHSITMNKKCNLFITICSNLSTPYKTYLYEITSQSNGVEKLNIKLLAQIICGREEPKTLNLNSEQYSINSNDLISAFSKMNTLLKLNLDSLLFSLPDESTIIQQLFKPPQIFTFFTNDDYKLYGMVYMPFNYEHGVKYPTVLYVYGGPKAQLVSNSYKANKYSRLNILALLGYCVVVIDSRGSDYRGKAFESFLNRKMGTVEINDQVMGLEAASKIFNCINMKKVAIYGWSYGGYMALMGISQRPDIFKVAISGAPVTSWTLYDTAYTERYMGLPEENKEAYIKGSVLNYVKGFPDEENRLLIVHGLIDENVHFIHTRQLINALIKENKPYQLQIYPNERHGIRSPEASIHCDVNFYSFLERNLIECD